MIRQKLLTVIFKILPTNVAYAHCDIPCGIYDPHLAQMAAHTVIRMTSLINDLKASSSEPLFDERKKIISQISRLTKVKDEHAELVKHEVRILWGDYFKEEHLKQYPELNDLVFRTMKLASKARQEVNIEAANELLDTVQEIAQIFWKTKNIKSAKIKSPYPSGATIVVPK
jgi:nickel superoxide dismutase